MKLVFQTNLDEAQQDVRELDRFDIRDHLDHPIPRVGENIRISFEKYDGSYKRDYYYQLQVVDVVYDYRAELVIAELHMPRVFSSIKEWTQYINRHRWGRE